MNQVSAEEVPLVNLPDAVMAETDQWEMVE
jgi:hypothetical protein